VTPSQRIAAVNWAPVRPNGDYVLYWMIAQRRTRSSFALDRAIARAEELGKPLLVFEALRCGYEWASARLHRFVIEGMADNARRLREAGVAYYAYLEPQPGEGRGLLAALAERACLVLTDEFPSFFLPRMVAAAGRKLPVLLEQVDGNGLLPLRATDRLFGRAVDFRRFLQKNLIPHLLEGPKADPLEGLALPRLASLPKGMEKRWPNIAPALEAGEAVDLARLPIDHKVKAVHERGGAAAGEVKLEDFVASRLQRYVDGRLDLQNRATSELSPYLHFGHVGTHQVFAAVTEAEGWHPGKLTGEVTASKSGFWGMSENAEAVFDQLITWRELGYNCSAKLENYDCYESLPEWAKKTLGEHAGDPRPTCYSLEELEAAETHDEIWNAAQRELLRDGKIHNYLRMLWGKKILEWSPSPQEALERMVHLNNKYALDGRNPNSYSGIFWCLGRYDRPWFPERPIFGTIRYMSSASTARKLNLKPYLAAYGAKGQGQGQASLF
jgi:deoxyribodipyrimidine photo-lyase